MGRTVQGSNPSEGEIFCSRPDWPWGPPYSCAMGTGSLSPEVKQLEHGVTIYHYLVPRWKKEYSCTLLPVLACTFTFLMEFLLDAACYMCKLSRHQYDYQYESDWGDPVWCNKLKVPRHSTRSLKTICASDFFYQTLLQQAMKQNIIWPCTCITERDLACDWVSFQLVWVCFSNSQGQELLGVLLFKR